MTPTTLEKEIKIFSGCVWRHYNKHGRHDLVWRKKTDPYSIVVSEIMLQQTQVARVEQYFDAWMKMFPTIEKLASAKLSQVLSQWQGLGYNRRGKYLHDIAQKVVSDFDEVFPTEGSDLRSLPGIGSYTQSAIEAFSYNKRSILVETNIRTAVIYHFFKNEDSVDEKQIEEILVRCYKPDTKAYKNPREWNWALMDYGSHLKKEVGNLNKKSKTYSRQSRFEGSRRQMRSGILKYILDKKRVTTQEVYDASLSRSTELLQDDVSAVARREEQIMRLLSELAQEGMIKKTTKGWSVR